MADNLSSDGPKPPEPPIEAETRPPARPAMLPVEAADIPLDLIDHPRYRVLRLLGRGGMGAVYLAEHRHMQRQVALKVISADFVSNPDAVRRFRQEVVAAARLGPHPNVVAVYDSDHVGQLHFLVMEYLEGQNLADYLRQRGPLPTAEACDYIRQAALGLQHASLQGMVHRDIKPHNLMRTPEGQIKVLDFGLARLVRDLHKPGSQLTQQGMLMGTADYMAPEQANDSRSVDVRADVYSLGCTLYHLLAGRVPFPDGGPVDKIVRHAVEAPTPLGTLRPDVPREVIEVTEKMMAKAPESRFQTAGEVAEALARCVIGAMQPSRVAEPAGSATLPTSQPSRPTGQTVSEADEAQRWIASCARFLLVNGYVHCVLGALLLMVGLGMAIAIQSNHSIHRVFLDNLSIVLFAFGMGYLVASPVVLLGATWMKSRQSYRLALVATLLSALPVTPFFPITLPLAIRCLLCLTNTEVRQSFHGR